MSNKDFDVKLLTVIITKTLFWIRVNLSLVLKNHYLDFNKM